MLKLALAIACAASGLVAASGYAAESAAGRIRSDLAWLAADDMQGRETGTAAYRRAARRLAREFAEIGLDPGANGSWFQDIGFRIDARRLDEARLEILRAGGAREAFVPLGDYAIGRALSSPRFDVEAPLVFAGYGVVDPVTGYDDYGSIDARGKIVVVFAGAPRQFDSETRAFLGGSDQKRLAAATKRAVGLLTLPTKASAERSPWPRVVEGAKRAGAVLMEADGSPVIAAPEIAASAVLSEAGATKLFAGEPKGFADLKALEESDPDKLAAFELGAVARLAGASAYKRVSSPNVVAMIEGRDADLKNEVVVLSAHLDHIGIARGAARGADRINNGALDNAIGVATLLEVARRLKAAPPRRTIVILATTGEEMGLLGAEYFARHPSVGARRVVADVNLDMPLMLYPFSDVIAFGAERSSLGDVAKSAAAEIGVALAPDPFPEEGVFTRSDHFRFVETGVPSIYLFAGFANGGEKAFETFMRERYHRPSDDLSQAIDFDAAARFADLNYLIAARIADADAAPSWTPGDYFGGMFSK